MLDAHGQSHKILTAASDWVPANKPTIYPRVVITPDPLPKKTPVIIPRKRT